MQAMKRTWDDMDTSAALDSFTAAFGDHQDVTNFSINSTTAGAKLDDNASAASRQKSCNACVRGKRRCDKRTPRCSRCSAKNLDCVYQKLPPGAGASTSAATSATTSATTSSNSPAIGSAANVSYSSSAGQSAGPQPPLDALMSGSCPISSNAATAGHNRLSTSGVVPTTGSSSSAATSSSSCVSDLPEFDLGFDIDSLGTATGTETSPESLQADVGLPLGSSAHGGGGLDFSIVDFMAQSAGAGDHDLWNLHPFATETADKLDVPPLPTGLAAAAAMPHPPMHQQLQPIRDLSLIKDCGDNCMEVDPLAVHDPNTRIGFTVNFLTSMHSTFAQTRALPFMHPRLWTGQLPKSVLAAFSASTAYVARNPSNKGWTVRLLVDAAREIHREGERAVSHADKLARVQALMILNTMRIFDGDLGLRAAAEREVTVLLSWLKELRSVRHELEAEEGINGVNGFVREGSPKSWESWILLESIRRTILTSYALICLSMMLKSELPDEEIWNEDNSFTASRHLWEAASSADFFRAWREKPQFMIKDMSFKEFWVYARPDDCDDFTKIMLTSQVGIDTMSHFMNGDTTIPVKPGRVP
ncbi:hypothetical protein QQS21_003954 [Conoideocrella luteorostrata]|uniref:Zn(2)-C6 fungal-type domain-containing protein n=1 Tax=Conoideocrella luteorostrata TaxID=1105319 RepID=A0AAJ0CV97_9HYPO|nr:hypothetical protein QQS21_003954 [Conoideocrella luteorostrata]